MACGPAAEDGEANAAAATASKNEAAEKTATKFRQDLAKLSVVVSACQTPENAADPSCPRDVLTALAGGTTTQAHPRGIFDWNALYQKILKSIGDAGKHSLCSYLETWKGFNNVYYNRGASVTGGAVRTITAGAELVYDIGDRQMAMFTYTGKAIGNVVGVSAGAYGGFAFSKNRHGLFDAWSGSSWGIATSVGVPETKILGITGTTFWNAEHDVVGVAAGLSVGINFINAWGVDASYFENEYKPWNAGTRHFRPAGATLETSGNDQYWSFGEANGLGAGWWLALEMIRFELDDVARATGKWGIAVSHPTWAAAMLTIGSEYVRFESAAKSIEDWCSGYAYVPKTSNCGSDIASLAPRTCAGGDLSGGDDDLEIPPPELTPQAIPDAQCGTDEGPSCDTLFPGQKLVCSNAGQLDSHCCRKPFVIEKLCAKDGDCGSGEVCARASDQSTDTVKFGCMKPGSQPCVTK